MVRGGAPYNIHDMNFAPSAISGATGSLLLQTKIPVSTTAGTVMQKDTTAFGTGLHMDIRVTGATNVMPIITLWRIPENFTMTQITSTSFYEACQRFQDMLWAIFLPKPRAVDGTNFCLEIAEQVTSKRTFGPKDTLVLVAHNPNSGAGASLTFVSQGFLDYFYA